MVDSPLVVATWVTTLLCAWSMQQVEGALHSAESVQRETARELARLAAEAAVCQMPLEGTADQTWDQQIGAVRVTVERRGSQVFATSKLSSGELYRYSTRVVGGAAPEVFGLSMSHLVPRLDPAVMVAAACASDLPVFNRDGGVALLHFDGGTDLEDFVFNVEGNALKELSASVITVPGHLWIEPGYGVLELSCAHDLTIVVTGNLYIGRTIEVVGPGRIVFVTLGGESARPFADHDGDGKRSQDDPAKVSREHVGAIEGGGSVYLGLRDSVEKIRVTAGLVIEGHLHLLRDATVVGPVVVAGLLINVEPGARLKATGQGTFLPQREVVPGFAGAGPCRAGLLSELPPRPGARD